MNERIKFCVVVNTNALKNQKLLDQIINLLKNNHDIEFIESKSIIEAKEIYKKLSLKKFDRLIITGGDGSFNFAINEVIKYPSLLNKEMGYIPLGTANILQIEANIKKKAKLIYETLTSKKIKKIYLSKANNDYFFLMAGVGFDSKIVESIGTNIKKYLGKIIFVYKGLVHFLFLKNEKMEIEIDNEKLLADWVLCTNAKYYAGPYSITNETNIFKPKVVIYIFKNLTRIKLLYYCWLIFTKGDLSSARSVVTKDLSHLKINKVNHQLLSQVDGENFGYSENIKIQTTDKYINLLVP